MSMRHGSRLTVIHSFCLEFGLNYELFKPYRDFIRNIKYGSERRCELTQHQAHQKNLQVHHIVPRCFKGENRMLNKVMLTPDEHKKAHSMFQKCLEETGKLIMVTIHNHF